MLTIVYSGNSAVFDGILISLLSIIKHNDTALDVRILTMEMTDRNPAFQAISERQRCYLETVIRQKNPDSRVTLTDVLPFFLDSLANSPNADTDYTPYAFLRLFLDQLPDFPDKVLYLDADTVINGDITQLYDTDINGYEFAGALDYYGRWFFNRRYINSGVLLLNLNEIRKTGLFQNTLSLCASKRIFLPDQTALNKLAKNKLIIDSKFNEQKHFKDDTVIQHFTKTIIWLPFFHTRNIKPWHVDMVKSVLTHKYDDILDSYLQHKKQFLKG